MIERAVNISERLHGVVSIPDDENEYRVRPGVIILNSGLLHKVGPYRMMVELARSLSGAGFCVLRFDLGGIGDSQISFTGKTLRDKALADIKIAIDCISENFGVKKFVMMGLCSGSDNAHRAALKYDCVVGSVHLDGYGFRNQSFYLNYYGKRMISKRFVKNKIASKLYQPPVSDTMIPVIDTRGREFPSLEQATKEYERLVARGVRLLYVYTWGVERYNNYKNQLRDTFSSVDFGHLLDVEFYQSAEHTYPTVGSKTRVISRVTNWLKSNFS